MGAVPSSACAPSNDEIGTRALCPRRCVRRSNSQLRTSAACLKQHTRRTSSVPRRGLKGACHGECPERVVAAAAAATTRLSRRRSAIIGGTAKTGRSTTATRTAGRVAIRSAASRSLVKGSLLPRHHPRVKGASHRPPQRRAALTPTNGRGSSASQLHPRPSDPSAARGGSRRRPVTWTKRRPQARRWRQAHLQRQPQTPRCSAAAFRRDCSASDVARTVRSRGTTSRQGRRPRQAGRSCADRPVASGASRRLRKGRRESKRHPRNHEARVSCWVC